MLSLYVPLLLIPWASVYISFQKRTFSDLKITDDYEERC